MTETTNPSGSGPLTLDQAADALAGMSDVMDLPEEAPETPQEAEEEAQATVEDDTAEAEPAEDAPEYEPEEEEAEAEEATPREPSKGEMLQADYTRKTQELAEQRRKVEAEWQRATEVNQQAQAVLRNFLSQDEPEPDWDTLKREDPYEFSQKVAEWQVSQHRKAQAYQQLQGLQAEQSQRQQQMEQAYIAEQEAKLLDLMPSWRKPETRQKATAQLVDYLKNDWGANDAEITALSKGDARVLAAVEKARLWDQLQANKGKVQKKVENKPPVKPGSSRTKADRRTEKVQTAQNRLKRTGRLNDAASAIDALLGKDLD